MDYLINSFFTNGVFIINGEQEKKTKIFFRESRVWAKCIEKIFDRYDDRPNIYYTDDIFRYFWNFGRFNRAEYGRWVDDIDKVLENEVERCFIPN